MKFDDILYANLGEWGRYQAIQFLLVCVPTIFTAIHSLSFTFAGVVPDHRCQAVDEDLTGNGTFWVSTTYPKGCLWLDSNGENRTCTSYRYDTSIVSRSAVNRWDLVCTRSSIVPTIQSAYYVGQLVGSYVFGYLGDRWGRKAVFFIAIVVQLLAGVGMAFSPSWWVYAICRAATGFSHPGIFVIAVVIGMELVGPSKRRLASVVTGAFFALGQVLLGLTAYHVRDYSMLHIVTTLPALVFLSYYWLVSESVRWLVTQHKYTEADAILQRAAKINGKVMPSQWWEQLDEVLAANKDGSADVVVQPPKSSVLDLIRTPRMRTRTLGVFFLWPVTSMVYYGLSMKSDVLGGDLYANFILGGALEMPALFIVFLLIDRVGRRIVLGTAYGLVTICLLTNIAGGTGLLASAQFLVGKAASTAAYASLYTFSPELFPTPVRNTAMGCCSMVARIGAIASSYVTMWIVAQWGRIWMLLPYGALAAAAALVTLLVLPETAGQPLPESVQQIEQDDNDQVSTHELEPLSANVNPSTAAVAKPAAATDNNV